MPLLVGLELVSRAMVVAALEGHQAQPLLAASLSGLAMAA